MLDYEAMRFWLMVLNTVGVAGLTVYTWWVNRNRATADAIELVKRANEKKVHGLEVRVQHAEQQLATQGQQLAQRLTLHDLSDLYEGLKTMNREIGENAAKLAAVANQLQLHQEYLMRERERRGEKG